MSRILVLGAGSWGTALAIALTRNAENEVFLWARDAASAIAMHESRANVRYLPDLELPASLCVVSDAGIPPAVDLIVAAVPFQSLRAVLKHVIERLDPPPCVACACKGLEHGTHARADQIVAQVLPPSSAFAMLSGPNFALEVAQGLPAAMSIATRDLSLGHDLVRQFHSNSLRAYLTRDIVGVQIGGAVKNVIAIAAGIGDGLGLGSNSRAALITRGLAEITRFGVAEGGELETFMGLSGLGDLVLTCTDDKSRNRRFGLSIGSGTAVEVAIQQIGLVEGATTASVVVELAEKRGVDMPISREVAAAIAGRTSPEEAVRNLLTRDPTIESLGLA